MSAQPAIRLPRWCQTLLHDAITKHADKIDPNILSNYYTSYKSSNGVIVVFGSGGIVLELIHTLKTLELGKPTIEASSYSVLPTEFMFETFTDYNRTLKDQNEILTSYEQEGILRHYLESVRSARLELYFYLTSKQSTPFVFYRKYCKLIRTKEGDLHDIFSMVEKTPESDRVMFTETTDEQAVKNYFTDRTDFQTVFFQLLHAVHILHSQSLVAYCDIQNSSLILDRVSKPVIICLQNNRLLSFENEIPYDMTLILTPKPERFGTSVRLDNGSLFCRLKPGPCVLLNSLIQSYELNPENPQTTPKNVDDEENTPELPSRFLTKEDEQLVTKKKHIISLSTELKEAFKENPILKFAKDSGEDLLMQLIDVNPLFSNQKSTAKNWIPRPERYFSLYEEGIVPVYSDVWDLGMLMVQLCCNSLDYKLFNEFYDFKPGRELKSNPNICEILTLHTRINYEKHLRYNPVTELKKHITKQFEHETVVELEKKYPKSFVRVVQPGSEDIDDNDVFIGMLLWIMSFGHGYLPDDSEFLEYGLHKLHSVMSDPVVIKHIGKLSKVLVEKRKPKVVPSPEDLFEVVEKSNIQNKKETLAQPTFVIEKENLASEILVHEMEHEVLESVENKPSKKTWTIFTLKTKSVPLFELVHRTIGEKLGSGGLDFIGQLFHWIPEKRTKHTHLQGQNIYTGTISNAPIKPSVFDLLQTDYFTGFSLSNEPVKKLFIDGRSNISDSYILSQSDCVNCSVSLVHNFAEPELDPLTFDNANVVHLTKAAFRSSKIN
jgi:hypothetical protein